MSTSASRKKTQATANGWAYTADQWRKRTVQNLTLPSGMQVTARIVGLGTLARMDALPKELTEVALLELSRDGGAAFAIAEQLRDAADGDEAATARTQELVTALGELTRRLVAEALIEPKLTYDDLGDVPEDDLEKLMRIVTRRDAFDSAGRVVGAIPVDELSVWQAEHGCVPGCEACERVARGLSTVEA